MNFKALLAAAALTLTVAAPASAGLSDDYHQQQQRVSDYKAQCELIWRSAEYRDDDTAYVIRNGIIWASSIGDCLAVGRLGAVESNSRETRSQWVIEDGRLVQYVQIIKSGSTMQMTVAEPVR